jgi:hypothetical protein
MTRRDTNSGDRQITDDGYIVVPERRQNAIKGYKCGKCGMRFDYGKAYGYYCPDFGCPIQPKVGGL